MRAKPSARRLLLLEFLFADRFSQFRGKSYPFLLGQARQLGVPAQWLCCWAPHGRDSRTRYVMDLEPETVAAPLLDAISDFAPTHLVISEKLNDELRLQLVERFPDVAVEDLAAAPTDRIVNWPADWLPKWLGVAASGGGDAPSTWLVDAVDPAYESTLLPSPPGAKEPKPAPAHVIAGPECIFRRALSRNQHYQGVEIPEHVRPFGCSFCPGPLDVRYPFETPPVKLALKQCFIALDTEDRCTSRADWVIDGAKVALRIDEFFRGILDRVGFPPSTFYFSYRADELLAVEKRIDAILPELEQAGHCIAIYNLGAENFSPDENERLNKGLTLQQIDRVTELTQRWEKQYPDTFLFTEKGGFGIILFTPWTRRDDLDINLKAMRRPGFEPEGFALTSKLQILPDSAIALLAHRDGLITDSFDDFHYYDSGCFSRWDHVELPWRFRSPVVGHLYKLACRVAPLTEFPDDDQLLADVQQLYQGRRDQFRDPLDFFSRAIAASRTEPEPESPEAILELLERSLPPPRPPGVDDPDDDPEPRPDSLALAGELRARLGMFLPTKTEGGKRLLLAGFELVDIAASAHRPYATIELAGAGGEGKLKLIVNRQGDVDSGFAEAGPYVVSYARETPLDSPSKQKAARMLAALIERQVKH